jgi:hypothetical protein
VTWLILIGMIVWVAGPSTAGAEDDFDSSLVTWTNLSYRGRKLMFSIHADIGIEILPSAGVEASLVEATLGKGIDPTGPLSALLTLTTRGLGSKALTQVWLGTETGVALQRLSQSEKSSRRHRKTYRFAETGVHMFFHHPAEGEDETRPENWTGGNNRFVTYPELAGDDLQVSESTALFYLLAVADLEASGDQFEFSVLSREELMLVELTVAGREKIKVDYIQESNGREIRIKRSVPAIKILVDAQPLDPDSEEADLRFLHLKGNIAIYLDPELRVPLRISGRVPFAGMAHVRIRRVVLK